MRAALWRECLAAISPDEAVILLDTLLAGVDRADPDARTAWLALLGVVDGLRGGPLALNIYAAARAAGAARVAALWLQPPPARPAGPEGVRPPPLDPEREVTLGERRAWARRSDRTRLERLLVDQDPGVVRNLLANPRITEADVVRMAARRPSTEACLITIFQHPRWGRSLAVVEALVYNPHTPVDLACGLVAWLDGGLARQVAESPAVHPRVRAEASRRSGLVVVGEGAGIEHTTDSSIEIHSAFQSMPSDHAEATVAAAGALEGDEAEDGEEADAEAEALLAWLELPSGLR